MENRLSLAEKNNVFLVDWLTVVFHGQTVFGIQSLLGLTGSIPWQERHNFVYGYPVTTFWNNICIRWGADREEFYSDDLEKKASEKVRSDMGICLEMSGTGCRAFESHGAGDWIKLLGDILQGCYGRVSITRLDLAYDDHTGLLDIYQIERDARDRNLVCKARMVRTTWSDDWDEDIQGLTVEIGSRKSDVLIRIYDKAAERGFDHSRHWIRVELQLRKDRALAAAMQVLEFGHVGRVASGILRNYCTFRSPTSDSNRCRWPLAPYWDRLLLDMEAIRIVLTPGEEYNFSKTEEHMKIQYGQAFIAYYRMHGEVSSFLYDCLKRFPTLKPKYQSAILDYQNLVNARKERVDSVRRFYGFQLLDPDDPLAQVDMAEIFGDSLLEGSL